MCCLDFERTMYVGTWHAAQLRMIGIRLGEAIVEEDDDAVEDVQSLIGEGPPAGDGQRPRPRDVVPHKGPWGLDWSSE